MSETAPSREPQVTRELAQLGNALDHLDKAMHGLFDRLVPVTSDATPVDKAHEAKETEQLVPLAEEIRAYRRRVQGVSSNLANRTSRLEL
jgi:hypothetical protein